MNYDGAKLLALNAFRAHLRPDPDLYHDMDCDAEHYSVLSAAYHADWGTPELAEAFDAMWDAAEHKKFPAWPNTSDGYLVFPDGSIRTCTAGDDKVYASEQDLIDDCSADFEESNNA